MVMLVDDEMCMYMYDYLLPCFVLSSAKERKVKETYARMIAMMTLLSSEFCFCSDRRVCPLDRLVMTFNMLTILVIDV